MSNASKFLAVLLLLCGLGATAQAQVPVGGEKFVSPTGTTPAVTVDPSGRFTLVWADHGETDWAIFGQVFSANGAVGGSRFVVNETTSGPQTAPKVAAGGDGRFTVVWQGGLAFTPENQSGGDGDGAGIFVRRFGAGGLAEGGQASASRSTASDQAAPEIAMGRQGDFVTAWTEEAGRSPGDRSAIVALRFSSSSSPLGPELRMETAADGQPSFPRVAMSSQGFAVGWSEALFCAPHQVQFVPALARFNAEGRRVGEVFRLAPGPCGVSEGSLLRALAGSRAGYLAVFIDFGTVSTYSAQRFSPTGEPVGGRFTIPGQFSGDASLKNDLLTGLAMDDRGRFVITWETFRTTDVRTERLLTAQVFSIRNRPLRKAILLGTDAVHSAVALANDGNLMVAWRQDGTGLKVRRFRLE